MMLQIRRGVEVKNVEKANKILGSSTDIIQTVATPTTISTLTINSIANGVSTSNSVLVPVNGVVGEAVVGQKRCRYGKVSSFWGQKSVVFFHQSTSTTVVTVAVRNVGAITLTANKEMQQCPLCVNNDIIICLFGECIFHSQALLYE